MSPTHTRKGNRLYRYYVSQDVLKRGPDACPVKAEPPVTNRNHATILAAPISVLNVRTAW